MTPQDPISADTALDVSGLRSPEPILALRRRVKALTKGTVLEFRATDSGTIHDVPAWCEQAGHALLMVREEDGTFVFSIQKGD